MNGSCAGGTGAFIDQMAQLLGVTADELDRLSLKSTRLYPIASRCGVFAKSDIQPLLNQGAKKEDIAASIFQAVVDQTVSGLAQGRKIAGNVLFLGGPLSFLKGLRKAFTETLHLDAEHAVFPDLAPCFMAYGCALQAHDISEAMTIDETLDKIINAKTADNIVTGTPLFKDRAEYEEFVARHKQSDLKYADIKTYSGDAYLGIDAGSTTTKPGPHHAGRQAALSALLLQQGSAARHYSLETGGHLPHSEPRTEHKSFGGNGLRRRPHKGGLGRRLRHSRNSSALQGGGFLLPRR